MANIALNEDVQLNLNMEAMTENTEGHCDEWNVRHQQLLENDQYLNGEQEKIKEPEFTAADTRENIASKEKLPKILGKIARFFSDLKEVAFSGKYSDLSGKPAIVNNNTTTEAGSALDARQANPTIEGTMANQILQLNNDFQNIVPWIQDCNSVNSHLAYATPNTLHTPSAEGKTTSTISLILTVITPLTPENTSINTQYSFTAVTGEIFVRTINVGKISEWKSIFS